VTSEYWIAIFASSFISYHSEEVKANQTAGGGLEGIETTECAVVQRCRNGNSVYNIFYTNIIIIQLYSMSQKSVTTLSIYIFN